MKEKIKKQELKNAEKLLKKYEDNEYISRLIKSYYGEDILVSTEKGLIDFSKEHVKNVSSNFLITYDDFLDIQIRAFEQKQRKWFRNCYYNLPSEFKGKIEKIGQQNICFEKIFVTGMYSDGLSFFDGKEDHVWMERTEFKDIEKAEGLKIGDCLSFYAEVYMYVKTGNGKSLDYGLRNAENIKKVDEYKLPTDKAILGQLANQIICETCYLADNCNHMSCMRNKREIEHLRKQMLVSLKNNKG